MDLVPTDTATAPTAPTPPDASEKSLVAEYTESLKIPTQLQKWFKAFEVDREYVNDKCMEVDAEDAVSTNHILRNQYLLSATIASRDADITWRPEDRMYPPALDPMTGMPSPGVAPDYLTDFGRTMTILIRGMLKENRFRQRLRGAVQDVETNNLVWIKVKQQVNYKTDPLGNTRFNDQLDNYALYEHMRGQIAAGEIAEDSAEMNKFKQLEQTVRQYLISGLQQDLVENPPTPPMVDPMMGMQMLPPSDPREIQLQQLESGTEIPSTLVPEVPKYIGIGLDFIAPDDVRVDWRITRPEDIYSARDIKHRVRMTVKEIGSKYGLSAEELKLLPACKNKGSSTDPSATYDAQQQLDDSLMGEEVSVWEVWDRTLNRVNVFIPGYEKLLHSYTPTATWRHWFPFILILFNRTTGRMVGVSSTALQRPAQEEMNLFRTHDRHAKKACFPRILVKKGVFRGGEKNKYQNSRPYEVIELHSVEDVKKAIHETTPLAYNGQLYDISRAEMDLQKMAGVSTVAGGVVGTADSATEVVTAQNGVDLLAKFKAGMLDDAIHDVGQCMADIAVQIMPQKNVVARCGPGAVWPPVDIETLYFNLGIELTNGSTGQPDTQKRLEFWDKAAAIITAMGGRPKPELLNVIGRDTGIHENLSRYFDIMPVPMPGAPGAPGSTGPSAPIGGPPLSLGPQQGVGGGAPPPGPGNAPKTVDNIPGPKFAN